MAKEAEIAALTVLVKNAIALILEAQGYKENGDVSEYWQAVHQAEMESRRKAAGKIADALLESGMLREV